MEIRLLSKWPTSQVSSSLCLNRIHVLSITMLLPNLALISFCPYPQSIRCYSILASNRVRLGREVEDIGTGPCTNSRTQNQLTFSLILVTMPVQCMTRKVSCESHVPQKMSRFVSTWLGWPRRRCFNFENNCVASILSE